MPRHLSGNWQTDASELPYERATQIPRPSGSPATLNVDRENFYRKTVMNMVEGSKSGLSLLCALTLTLGSSLYAEAANEGRVNNAQRLNTMRARAEQRFTRQ